MATLKLNAKIRSTAGRGLLRARKAGSMPAVAYGHGVKTLSLELTQREFEKIFSKAGSSTIIELVLDGETHNVLIQDVQFGPVNGLPIHADFYKIRMDEKLKAEVPLNFIGISPAVKNFGGILVKSVDKLEVEALPKDLPHEITVDLSSLEELNAKIALKDLVIPPGVTVMVEDKGIAIVSVERPRSEEELKALDEAVTEDVEAIEGVTKPEEGEEVATEGKEGEKANAKEAKESGDAKGGDKADKVVGKTGKPS